MNNVNKQIISYCPNFYKIIDFKPLEEDPIYEKLVRLYQKYIFKIDVNNEDDINTVREIDKAVGQYINDYMFRKELQKELLNIKVRRDATDVLKDIIKSIIKIFNNYEEGTTRIIYVSRWI